jgi:antitoxin component HigA of HigAB toxin-antitoxin module
MKQYLNRVLLYLKQELPNPYKESIELDEDTFVITLPDDEHFTIKCSEVHVKICTHIERVRTREYDLHFTIRSSRLQKDFTIVK